MSFLCATQESNEKSHEGLANRVKGFSVLADFFSEKAQPGLLVLSEAQYANIKTSIPANNKNILIQFDEDTPPDKLAHLAQQAWDQKQLVLYVKKSTLIQNNIENFIHYFRKTMGILFLDEVMYEQLMGQNSHIFEGITIFNPCMALTPEQLTEAAILFTTNGDPATIKELVRANLKSRCHCTPKMFSKDDEIIADVLIQMLVNVSLKNTEAFLGHLKDMLVTFSSIEEALSPHHFLDQLSQRIYRLSSTKSWVFGGAIGRSSYKLDDGITPIPEGVRLILDIIKDNQLSDNDKIVSILTIAEERKGIRVASILSLGLFTRDESTKNFYDNLYKEIAQNFPQAVKEKQANDRLPAPYFSF